MDLRATHARRFLDEIKRTRAFGTWEDYKQKLGLVELDEFEKTRCRGSLSTRPGARLVGDVHRSGREATAEGMADSFVDVDMAGARHRNRPLGVQVDAMRGLRAPERTRRPSKRIVSEPSLEDLGRVVAICRAGVIDPVVSCGIEMLVWTLQRRRAVVGAMLEGLQADRIGR